MTLSVYSESEKILRREDLRRWLADRGWFVHFAPPTGRDALVLEGPLRHDIVWGAADPSSADEIRRQILSGRIPRAAPCTIVVEIPKADLREIREKRGPRIASSVDRAKVRYLVEGKGPLADLVSEIILQRTDGIRVP